MKTLTLLLAISFASTVFLAGCGGSGSSSGSGGGVTTSENAVEEGVVYPVAGQRMFTDYAGDIVNALGVINPNPAQVYYDQNLYYTLTPVNNALTINFYTNQAATIPAGSIAITSSGATYPITYVCVVNVTGGNRPAQGTLTLTQQSAGFQRFQLSGTLTEEEATGPWGIVTWNFNLVSQNGLLNGSLSASNGTETVSLTDITEQEVGANKVITGALTVEPQGISTTFSFTVSTSGVGTVSLGSGASANISGAGAGTISLPSGGSITIANFYQGV